MDTTSQKHMKGGMDFSYQQVNTHDEKNKEAEHLLFEAWKVAGYGGKSDEDYYPRTSCETEKMEKLLNQAEEAINDTSDQDLMNAIVETQQVVKWSKARHWTFAWWIIICVIIMGAYYFYQAENKKEYVKRQQSLTEAQVQQMLNAEIDHQQKCVTESQNILANDTISREERAMRKDLLDKENKKMETLTQHTTKTYKEDLVNQANAAVWQERREGIWCFIWVVLYIFACRPRGYMITKRRREDKMATGLKKILFGIAGGLVGAAGALYVTETVTKWSDGSKTRENDGVMIYVMKFGLIALAILIVLWAARIVIVIATILGLVRNYDWKQITRNPNSLLQDLK